jgi:hypothetical protein
MSLGADPPSMIQAIRRLTFAVWAVVLALALNIVALLWTSFLPNVIANQVNRAILGEKSFASRPQVDEFNGFSDWTVEKQIQKSSVIAITTFKKDSGKLTSIITSIPKQDADTSFNYQLGDEYVRGNRFPRENTDYGDGEVIFFTGSPPMMRLSWSYADGRIGGLGEMPMAKFIELIKASE